MKRRESLKLIVTGAVAVPAVVAGCGPDEKKAVAAADPTFNLDRNPAEIENEKRILAMDKFFTDHEMATITILGDIIIPKDDVSGSASDAKVPEFIEFIVKDMPDYQVPVRGGLRWIDREAYNRFQKPFKDIDNAQRIQIVDDIAYPLKAKPEMSQGVSFFNMMRDLVCTGFYTTKMGIEDIGYAGNQPNQWNGVPDDVLKQYGLAYTEKELRECVSYS